MSGQRVAVVGDDDLEAAVAAADAEVVDDGATDASFVVVESEAALVDLARQGTDVPVLPVDAGPGTWSVPTSEVTTAVTRVLDGDVRTRSLPVLQVGRGEKALFDVGLLAAEPARISAFSIRYGGERVAEFRADGVVASTPAGSVGYNREADGPVLAPGAGVVAVVPIASFATTADRMVLPPDELTLAVERDETPVELLLDGRIERTVSPSDPVTLAPTGGIDLLVVEESRSFF